MNDEMKEFIDDITALVYLRSCKYKTAESRELERGIRERLEDYGCGVVVRLLAERKHRKLSSELKVLETVYPDLKS